MTDSAQLSALSSVRVAVGMLTPPLHFGIACAPAQHSASTSSQILYRGAIPVRRNLEFVDRLQLKTMLVFSKKELKPDCDVVRWANGEGLGVAGKGKGKCRKVEIQWIKAGKMEAEELGIGRAEVNEVLKIVVQPANYPLYIADADGLTHTSLVIGALRKLMGWHTDSILGELERFDADDEDLPFASFFASYASPSLPDTADSKSESAALQLPNPPYPCWLWPTTGPPNGSLHPKGKSRSGSMSTTEKASVPPPAEPPKLSETFPYPPSVRRHPTMRLVFPPVHAEAVQPVHSPKKVRRVSFHASPVASPTLAAVAAALDTRGEIKDSGSIARPESEKETERLPVDSPGREEHEMEEYDDEEEEEYDDDEEEEEEEEEDEKAAPSQLISALDLEGF